MQFFRPCSFDRSGTVADGAPGLDSPLARKETATRLLVHSVPMQWNSSDTRGTLRRDRNARGRAE